MLFHSYVFIFLFLPVVVVGYKVLSGYDKKISYFWLVVCSIFFYGWWDIAFVPLILVSCAVNYTVGLVLLQRRSMYTLSLGVIFNLSIIGYYKYFGFAADISNGLFGTDWVVGAIILPLGISFYTFQQVAYLVDCYHKKTEKHHWVEYFLFVTFFPQLIAGPIVHQSEILSQFARNANVLSRRRDISIGLTIFVIGLGKKVIIAESLSDFSAPVFDAAANGATISFLEAWGGSLAFTFQIYFDFSGYSDMAIGLARLFGVMLPLNFNSPLRATSIIDFWQRWHMTLSRFFNTYLFNPMVLRATRRRALKGKSIRANSIMEPGAFFSLLVAPTLITMFLTGLWHGAGWNFVIFGLIHGVLLVLNHVWRTVSHLVAWRNHIPRSLRVAGAWLVTFGCVNFSIVLFRAVDMDAAMNIFTGMMAGDGRMIVPVGYTPVVSVLEAIFGAVVVTDTPYTTIPFYFGREQIMWLAASALIVLLLPNTRMLMSRYRPALNTSKMATPEKYRWLQWRPNVYWGVVMVVIFSISVVYSFQPTEFLYFQF